MTTEVHECVAVIRARAPAFTPRVGIVLGSGLGGYADQAERVATIPYADLPGFPLPGVAGHSGELVLGRIGGTPVALLSGRAHYYEHGRADVMKVAVRTLAALGCEHLGPHQLGRQPAARGGARQRDADHRPHQFHRPVAAVRRERQGAFRRHGRRL